MVYMIITLLIHYICHVQIQLKSIGRYQGFVALLIQIDITNNSIDTDTGINIGESVRHSLLQILLTLGCVNPYLGLR